MRRTVDEQEAIYGVRGSIFGSVGQVDTSKCTVC